MNRQAVIDVGTNSVKFHLGELQADGTWSTVIDRAEVTRLGEGIQETGAIAPAALERTAVAIAGMTAEAASNRALGVTVVGTMGLRTATNSQALIELVKEQTGATIEIISGEEESRLGFLAVKSGLGLGDGTLVVFDTGGGSSQFTLGRGARVDREFSVNVGAVRYTERYQLDDAISPDALRLVIENIRTDLAALDGIDPPDTVVGMGGAITNMTAVMQRLAQYDPDKVQGSVIDRTEVDRQIALYCGLPATGRRQIVGLQPKRAEVILAGACIVGTIMDKLKTRSVSVSDRGLRHGLLIDRFGGKLA
jgi:exopolyphosphatase / guanosine-5'-triphosphate,3'-diphosphate pyrophosphatase